MFVNMEGYKWSVFLLMFSFLCQNVHIHAALLAQGDIALHDFKLQLQIELQSTKLMYNLHQNVMFGPKRLKFEFQDSGLGSKSQLLYY